VKAVKLIAMMALGLTACSHLQPNQPVRHIRYIIDSGTTGWVKVTYNRRDAPELPVQDGFAVVHLTAQNLSVATRDRMNPSWDGSEFYYQSPDGNRVRLSSADNDQRLLWAMEKTSDNDGEREAFFVGKEEQLNHLPRSSTEMGTGLLQTKPVDPKKMVDEHTDSPKVDSVLPK
jgi:hypothetical protein